MKCRIQKLLFTTSIYKTSIMSTFQCPLSAKRRSYKMSSWGKKCQCCERSWTYASLHFVFDPCIQWRLYCTVFGAQMGWINEIKKMPKISWHCPFKGKWLNTFIFQGPFTAVLQYSEVDKWFLDRTILIIFRYRIRNVLVRRDFMLHQVIL